MKDKYYTPTLEEFHVGFEYEELWKKIWKKKILQPDDLNSSIDFPCTLYEIKNNLQFADIKTYKVKYLNKEDIESCGFSDYKHSIADWWSLKGSFHTPGGRHLLTEYKLNYTYDNHELHIEGFFGGKSEGMLFEGIIRNISELKIILKQIGIIKE